MTATQTGQESAAARRVIIRPLREGDLDAADRIMRLAFGTFIGLPDPLTFLGDADLAHTRWRADPTASIAAELDGELVGSNFLTQWGSVGFFGPLSIRPDLWDAGIAQLLLRPTMQLFAERGVTHAGLFTFPHSTKHIHLYQKFDFWPRFLTALMAKAVGPVASEPVWSAYSAAPEQQRVELLAACRQITDAIYPGFDVEGEIRATAAQQLGDTVLLRRGDAVVGLAVCHCGPGTEAGSDTCYIKVGAVLPGAGAGEDFEALLAACEALAAARGLAQLHGGMNTSQQDAYRRMLDRGFRARMTGIAMQRQNAPGYNTPDRYVISDWR